MPTRTTPHSRLSYGRIRIEKKEQFALTDPFSAESYKTDASGMYRGHVDWITTTKVGGAVWIGCTFFYDNTLRYDLKAVWPDGRRATYRSRIPMYGQVAYQGGDIYWVAARDGLLRLRLTGKGAKSRLVLDKRYPRIVAQGAVKWMAIGPDGALWMSTLYGKSGLYRIEIPPLDKQKK